MGKRIKKEDWASKFRKSFHLGLSLTFDLWCCSDFIKSDEIQHKLA